MLDDEGVFVYIFIQILSFMYPRFSDVINNRTIRYAPSTV
jgi:hypothetical protein